MINRRDFKDNLCRMPGLWEFEDSVKHSQHYGFGSLQHQCIRCVVTAVTGLATQKKKINGFVENSTENPCYMSYPVFFFGVSCRISLKPIHWTNGCRTSKVSLKPNHDFSEKRRSMIYTERGWSFAKQPRSRISNLNPGILSRRAHFFIAGIIKKTIPADRYQPQAQDVKIKASPIENLEMYWIVLNRQIYWGPMILRFCFVS